MQLMFDTRRGKNCNCIQLRPRYKISHKCSFYFFHSYFFRLFPSYIFSLFLRLVFYICFRSVYADFIISGLFTNFAILLAYVVTSCPYL